jgi:hypothetical protein
MNLALTGITTLLAVAQCASASTAEIAWSRVDQAMGKKGSDQPGGVHRYGFLRTDLNLMVDGVAVKAALALGSWIAFQPAGDAAMNIGDWCPPTAS